MSRNVKNNVSNKSAAPVQKFCKVCQDAGKSEAEYRSHFTRETRDPNSKVTCPTLLALECRYCFKNGHTVKYCEVLKKNQKQQKREEQAEARRTVTKTEAVKPKGKPTNVFMCLDSDSEEEIQKPVVKEEFPTLCVPAIARSQSVAVNYAAALAKPVVEKPVVVEKPAVIVKPVAKPATIAKAAPWASETKQANRSWAAWDSESEDEDEDEDESPCCWDNQTVEYDPYKPYAISFGDEDETW
jgi:hypothetical protein